MHNPLITERKQWALDQRELAELIGISRRALHRFEYSTRLPGALAIALALELAFGKSISELYPSVRQTVASRMVEHASDLSSRIEHHTGGVAERKREYLAGLAERLTNALEA